MRHHSYQYGISKYLFVLLAFFCLVSDSQFWKFGSSDTDKLDASDVKLKSIETVGHRIGRRDGNGSKSEAVAASDVRRRLADPSSMPSSVPSSAPTIPTGQPTGEPTGEPTSEPTGEPSSQPSGSPTSMPTLGCTMCAAGNYWNDELESCRTCDPGYY